MRAHPGWRSLMKLIIKKIAIHLRTASGFRSEWSVTKDQSIAGIAGIGVTASVLGIGCDATIMSDIYSSYDIVFNLFRSLSAYRMKRFVFWVKLLSKQFLCQKYDLFGDRQRLAAIAVNQKLFDRRENSFASTASLVWLALDKSVQLWCDSIGKVSESLTFVHWVDGRSEKRGLNIQSVFGCDACDGSGDASDGSDASDASNLAIHLWSRWKRGFKNEAIVNRCDKEHSYYDQCDAVLADQPSM